MLIESYYLEGSRPRRRRPGGAACARGHGIDLSVALDAFRRRLDLLVEADVAIAEAEFASEFGRDLQYYTGFVFEFTAAWLGRNSPVAGGGRYDTLLEAVGAANQVPAVGACIHTKRLREVLEEAAP